LKSWGSSTEVVENLVSDLDCVSKKVLYPELLVFSYAVFNSDKINISVRTTTAAIINNIFMICFMIHFYI
jgi:hypothetical protein